MGCLAVALDSSGCNSVCMGAHAGLVSGHQHLILHHNWRGLREAQASTCQAKRMDAFQANSLPASLCHNRMSRCSRCVMAEQMCHG